MISFPQHDQERRGRPGKAVVCVESSLKFPSCAAAARSVGISESTIYVSLNTGISAGGFHWRRSGRIAVKPRPSADKPVTCTYPDGTDQWFPSIKSAVKHTQLTRRQIEYALWKGVDQQGQGWKYAEPQIQGA